MPYPEKESMESSEFAEKWPALREQLLKDHPNLTAEDLYYEIGKEEELLIRLQEKLNKTKKEIRNWLHIMG